MQQSDPTRNPNERSNKTISRATSIPKVTSTTRINNAQARKQTSKPEIPTNAQQNTRIRKSQS